MESLEHAMKRGAPIIAEYLGGAINCDAYHMTDPRADGLGVSTCIERSLEDAGVSPEEVIIRTQFIVNLRQIFSFFGLTKCSLFLLYWFLLVMYSVTVASFVCLAYYKVLLIMLVLEFLTKKSSFKPITMLSFFHHSKYILLYLVSIKPSIYFVQITYSC